MDKMWIMVYLLWSTALNAKPTSTADPGDVRLVGGASRCAGRLEMKHQREWRPGFGSNWNMNSASVVCRQLRCRSAVGTVEIPGPKVPVWYIRTSCVGSESALRQCVTMRSVYSPSRLEVVCSQDLLFEPVISVSCPIKGVSEGQQQGLWVMEGSSVTVSCSIQPQYPGGSFQLTFTGANATRTYTQTAVDHSAHFLFPAADHAHQGNYSCVYRVTAFSHEFTSESHFLSLTVKDLLFEPIISVSCPIKGVSEGQQQGLWVMEGFNFSMDCSIQPQYPGGSFQLTFIGANATRTYTQTAVNHSAHFLFPAADHAHQGNYSCVYRVTAFSHDFTSESHFLSLTVKASHLKAFLIRVAVVMTILWGQFIFQCIYWKRRATRMQQRAAVENMEMAYVNVAASSADARPSEDEGDDEEPEELLE